MIDPNEYWVNNPLITPVNKALLYDNAIFMAKADEQDRIIEMLEKDAERNACSCGHICVAYDNGFDDAIDLIKRSRHEQVD